MESIVFVVAAALGFFLSAVTGKYLIPYLHKLKYGQTIKEIGPTWHKNKQGTPTMGGLMFIGATVVVVVLGYFVLLSMGLVSTQQTVGLFAGLVMSLAFGAMGFADDFISIRKKQNTGLTPKQKMIVMIVITALYLLVMGLFGGMTTQLVIPFIGSVDLGWFYWILMAFVIVGFTNAVNLTDGIDGLAGSVTVVVCAAMMVFSSMLSNASLGLYSAGVGGALCGFLVWNFHPAKVFMGDTGSMFLGGCVCAFACSLGCPLILILVGVIYWVEAFSVILQRVYFKLTHGKRIFKMSPIHHHFEMCGWSEVKIVAVFSIVTLIFCIIAFFAVQGMVEDYNAAMQEQLMAMMEQ